MCGVDRMTTKSVEQFNTMYKNNARDVNMNIQTWNDWPRSVMAGQGLLMARVPGYDDDDSDVTN